MMKTIKSTEMRKDFSFYIDEIVRRKPVFVKRSRDLFLGISFEMMKDLVSDIGFTAMMYMESDGSITLSLNEFDIVVNGKNQEEALNRLVNDLKEYAEEYYEQIEFWYNDPTAQGSFKYHYGKPGTAFEHRRDLRSGQDPMPGHRIGNGL